MVDSDVNVVNVPNGRSLAQALTEPTTRVVKFLGENFYKILFGAFIFIYCALNFKKIFSFLSSHYRLCPYNKGSLRDSSFCEFASNPGFRVEKGRSNKKRCVSPPRKSTTTDTQAVIQEQKKLETQKSKKSNKEKKSKMTKEEAWKNENQEQIGNSIIELARNYSGKKKEEVKVVNEYLFEENASEFHGKIIPNWMKSITLEQARITLSSVCLKDNESFVEYEYKRAAKHAVRNFDDVNLVRTFYMDYFYSRNENVDVFREKKNVDDMPYNTNPIYHVDFNNKNLDYLDDYNDLFYILKSVYVKRNILTISNMYSMIKSMKKSPYIKDKYMGSQFDTYVLDWFDKKMIIPTNGTIEEFSKDINWALYFLDPICYKFEWTGKYRTFLTKHLKKMKHKILKNLKMYLERGTLTKRQLNDLRFHRRDWMIKEMRSKRIQALFLQGYDKKVITDMLYKEYDDKAKATELNDSVEVQQKVNASRKSKDLQIKKARSNKYYDDECIDDGFETESGKKKSENWFVAFFRAIIDWFKALYAAPHRINKTVDRFDYLLNFNPVNLFTSGTDKDIISMIELKSVLHGLYDIYIGNYKSAVNWFSNFIITRGSKIMDIVNNTHIDDEEDFKKENGSVSSLIGTLFSEIGLIGKSDEDIRRANNAYNLMKNQQFIMKNRVEAGKSIASFVTKALFGYDIFNKDEFLLHSQMIDFINFMYKNAENFDSLAKNSELIEEVMQRYLQTLEIISHPAFDSMSGKLVEVFREQSKSLDRYYRAAKAYSSDNKPRIEPTTLVVRGKSGSGKSTLVGNVMKLVYYLEKEVPYDPSDVYIDGPGEFYEGYCGQFMTSIPDMFTTTNIQKRSDQAEDFNYLVSTDPYNVPMAFNDKGKVKFTSAYIFVSTNLGKEGNMENLNIGLTDSVAFSRRIDLLVTRNDPMNDPKTDLFQCEYRIGNKRWELRDLNMFEIAKVMVMLRSDKIKHFKSLDLTVEEIKEQMAKVTFTDYPVKPNTKPIVISADRVTNELKDKRKKGDKKIDAFNDFTASVKKKDDYWIQPTDDSKESFAPTSSSKGGFNTESGNSENFDTRERSSSIDTVESLTKDQMFEELRNKYEEKKHRFIDCNKPGFDAYFEAKKKEALEKFPHRMRDIHNPTSSDNTWKRAQNKQTNRRNNFIRTEFESHTTAYRWCLDHNIFEIIEGVRPIFMLLFFVFVVWKIGNKVLEHFVPESRQFRKTKTKEDKSKMRKTARAKKENGFFKSASGKMPFVDQTKIMYGLITIYEDCDDPYFANGFHYKDGICFTAAHYLREAEQKGVRNHFIGYTSQNHKYVEQKISITDWSYAEGDDLAWFKIPETCSHPIALDKYVISLDEAGMIDVGDKLKMITYVNDGSVIDVTFDVESTTASYNYYSATVPVFLQHAVSCTSKQVTSENPGMSGSLYLQPIGNSYKIVAIHAGSKKQFSVGSCIDQTYLEDLLEFKTESGYFPHSIERILPDNQAHHAPTQSKINPTKLYGWNGFPKYVRAYLRSFTCADGTIVNPWELALKKLHQVKTKTDFDFKLALSACRNYFKPDLANKKFKKILSIHEAVSAADCETLNPVVPNTSSGFPHTLEGFKGKSEFLERDENDRLRPTQKLLELVKRCDDKLKNNQQIEVLWADVLKDETREASKVFAGKTRLFSICPVEYLILMRMYFGGFIDYIQSTVLTHPCAVGINVHGFDWKLLYYQLNAHNGSVIAGDFSNYDGILPREVGEVFLALVNEFYDDEFSEVRSLLMEHIFNATHVHLNNVYQVVDGNPSGNPLTAIYNSICNVVMCYIVLVCDLKLPPDSFTMTIYGDDNVITTNQGNIKCSDLAPHFLRRFGMTYTHFSKESNDDVDTLESISYLGRKFKNVMGHFYAPLEIETVVEMTYWFKKSAQSEQALVCDTFRSFQRELIHHGEKVYNFYIKKFFRAVKKRAPQWMDLLTSLKKDFYSYDFELKNFDNIKTQNWIRSVIDKINAKKSFNFSFKGYALELEESVDEFEFNPEAGASMKHNVPDTDTNPSSTNDRNENVLTTTTQHVELGLYKDVNQVENSRDFDKVFLNSVNDMNFEGFNLNNILNREYPLPSITWTTDDPNGKSLAEFYFPEQLFNIPFVKDKLKDFRLFKGGVRITFRVAAARTLYGRLIAAWMPMAHLDRHVGKWSNQSLTATVRKSGFPHVLISASSADTIVMDIPFCYNRRAIDMYDYEEDDIARVWLNVLNPLTDINGESNLAQVLVTVQFLDAQAFMPDGFSTESGEAAAKSERGIISKALEATMPIASALESSPFTAPYASVYKSTAGKAVKVARMFGLNKPNTEAITQVGKINPYADMNPGHGLDLGVKFAVDPNNGISTDVQVGATSYDEMDLQTIVCTPAMVDCITYHQNTPEHLLLGSNALNKHCFLDLIAQSFAYHYGSIRFIVYVSASTFQNIDGVVWMGPPGSIWENCYHQNVKIEGDTKFEFVIPYTNSKAARNLFDTGTWNLYFKPLIWSDTIPALDCPIYFNVYKASGGDFKFACPLDMAATFSPECGPREDFKKPPELVHPSFKQYDQHNLLFGEEVKSLREILHRYYPQNPVQNSNNAFSLYFSRPTSVKANDYYSLFYAFYRGSIRAKFVQTDTKPRVTLACLDNSFDYPVVSMSMSSVTNPLTEIELPWYSDKYFLGANPKSAEPTYPFRVYHSSNSNYPSFMFKAYGDDFSFHFLKLPYEANVTRNAANYKDFFQNFIVPSLNSD